MSNAVIEFVPGTNNLVVQRDGYSWRRTAGVWEMQGRTGEWFACEIQDPHVQRQVADFEFCLRPYAFNEGPDFPKGRKRGENIDKFIRRLQVSELRKGTKNIFAPVPMNYTPGAEQARVRAAHTRTLSAPYSEDFRRHLTA